MWAYKQSGFTLLEVLVSMAVLSVGATLYAKSMTSAIAISTDNAEKQQAAVVATDLNNVFAAHVAPLGPEASRGQVIERMQRLANQFEKEMEQLAKQRGYTCKAQKPAPLATSQSGKTDLLKASVLQNWTQGPPICLKIEIKPEVQTGFNGVWMETQITWVGLFSNDDQLQRIRLPSLIAPM